MRKTALLLGMLALIFPPSVRSDHPNANPRYVFEISLADTLPIQLLPRIHFLAPKNTDLVGCFIGRDLETASFTFSLNQDDWTLLPIGNQPEVWFYDGISN